MKNFIQEGVELTVAVADIDSGDPVVVGDRGLHGVAEIDTDSDGNVVIRTSGVFDLSVKGIQDEGNVAIAIGDPIFYVAGDSPVLSAKQSGYFFGYALEAVTSGSTSTIEVLVCQMRSLSDIVRDGFDVQLKDGDSLEFGDAKDVSMAWGGSRLTISSTIANANLGDGYGLHEIDITTTGENAGHVAAASAWLNVNSTVAAGGNLVTPRSDGIYVNTGGDGDLSDAIVCYGGSLQFIGDANAAHLAIWRVNMSGGDTCEGIFLMYNGVPTNELGYVEDDTTDDSKIGAVPLFVDANTGTQYWVRIYDGES